MTMEVILSAAFGTESESQTNPDNNFTIVMMIPIIGKKLFKVITLNSWGFYSKPMIDVAKSIIKSRKESKDSARVVCPLFIVKYSSTLL